MNHEDFGRYLAQQRQLRGLRLEDVSRETKISESLLRALETGQAERMPERIFVLNYVRAYAVAIGLEPEEAVLRYSEAVSPQEPGPELVTLEKARRQKALRTFGLVAAGFFALVLVLFWLMGGPGGRVPH